ncbi:hypothetical protein QFZ30_003870 [Arthrobacter pascens]|nr:hypothetical protein [Arthrobacter pascens]
MYPFQGYSVAGRAGEALQRDAYVVYLLRIYGPQVTGRAAQSERKINDGGILAYICSVTIAYITCPAVVRRR